MIRLIWTFAGAFLITVLVGAFLVPALRRAKAGQSIREDGPTWHMSKQGTPTMGGLMFIFGIGVMCVIGGWELIREGEWAHIAVFAFALVYAAIGFLDDYEKLKKKQNLGLTALQKFVLQLAAAVAFIILLRNLGHLNTDIYVPFFNITWHVSDIVYYVFAAFVIVGCVNAVNITDGVDGLAAGVSVPVMAVFGAIGAAGAAAGFSQSGYYAAAVLAAAATGGLVGFLVFNFYPAKVFMGDTGSLFLGGLICGLAFALDMPLILVPLGIVYIIETLSDIIQVIYFKLTHGKRIFKMAPLHHHLEMCGWGERRIFLVFTMISAAFAVISFFGTLNRF